MVDSKGLGGDWVLDTYQFISVCVCVCLFFLFMCVFVGGWACEKETKHKDTKTQRHKNQTSPAARERETYIEQKESMRKTACIRGGREYMFLVSFTLLRACVCVCRHCMLLLPLPKTLPLPPPLLPCYLLDQFSLSITSLLI
jgi:hypothetical protein